MAGRFVRRKAHSRLHKSGGVVQVKEHFVWMPSAGKPRKPHTNICPICRASIRTVPMPNGGWGHFESGKGISKIKHACFTIGLGMSAARDNETPDLFEAREGDS